MDDWERLFAAMSGDVRRIEGASLGRCEANAPIKTLVEHPSVLSAHFSLLSLQSKSPYLNYESVNLDERSSPLQSDMASKMYI